MRNDLLGAHPEADVKVYAVWFSMFPGDKRSSWPATLLDDPRVRHYWDEGRTLGAWYGDQVTQPGSGGGHIEWDAYFLYDRGVEWTQGPPRHVSWGRTIVASRAQQKADLERLLKGSQGAPN